MRQKYYLQFIFLIVITLTSCTTSATSTVATPIASMLPATPEAPSGTIIKRDSSGIELSHPEFYWAVTLPGDWVIHYDSGFQLIASNPDQSVFARLQAQRWKAVEERLPDAHAYVNHWKNFIYGDVFPLFADGTLVSEAEISSEKFGGPYLQFEFTDSKKDLHYVQVYASAGGPSSALISTWTKNSEYEKVQATMQGILDSFQLLEEAQ